MPDALIIRTAGTNCDAELAHAFRLAGATPILLHLNELIADPSPIQQADLIGFPGGFTYGDDIAAGRILANRLRERLLSQLLDARDRGVPMIAICNGFQVLVKLGILPDPGDDRQCTQTATLAENDSGRFVDRWVKLAAGESRCVWTRDIATHDLPIAHGEGRFCTDASALNTLEQQGQIALRYAAGANPNGSMGDVAGICDSTGLIFGLMPHPERFVDATQHPNWTRWSAEQRDEPTAGLKMFQNAVAHVNDAASATATAAATATASEPASAALSSSDAASDSTSDASSAAASETPAASDA